MAMLPEDGFCRGRVHLKAIPRSDAACATVSPHWTNRQEAMDGEKDWHKAVTAVRTNAKSGRERFETLQLQMQLALFSDRQRLQELQQRDRLSAFQGLYMVHTCLEPFEEIHLRFTRPPGHLTLFAKPKKVAERRGSPE